MCNTHFWIPTRVKSSGGLNEELVSHVGVVKLAEKLFPVTLSRLLEKGYFCQFSLWAVRINSCNLGDWSAAKGEVAYQSNTVVSYQNENFSIKMGIFSFAFLLSPPFITQGRMRARKAVLILMKNSHFDRTLR